MSRERFNWAALVPFPRKKRVEGDTVDSLADRKFHRHKAKHKGRPHFYAYQKRQRLKVKKKDADKLNAARADAVEKYKNGVRSFLRGEKDEHP